MFKTIKVSELNTLHNVNIIDIRSNEHYNNNHIENAINILANALIDNPSKYLNKYEKYYIYCQRGIQSRKICQILSNKGFNVVNILGGYEAWILNQ